MKSDIIDTLHTHTKREFYKIIKSFFSVDSLVNLKSISSMNRKSSFISLFLLSYIFLKFKLKFY